MFRLGCEEKKKERKSNPYKYYRKFCVSFLVLWQNIKQEQLKDERVYIFWGNKPLLGKDMAGAGAVDIVKSDEGWCSSLLLLSVHNPDPG